MIDSSKTFLSGLWKPIICATAILSRCDVGLTGGGDEQTLARQWCAEPALFRMAEIASVWQEYSRFRAEAPGRGECQLSPPLPSLLFKWATLEQQADRAFLRFVLKTKRLPFPEKINLVLFFILFFYPHPRTFFSLLLEREKGREGEEERLIGERNINWLPPVHTWTGPGIRDQTHNLGMCSDQELNPQPFG